jgi:hypothetical protein
VLSQLIAARSRLAFAFLMIECVVTLGIAFMFKKSQILILFVLLCLGCDIAAKQQQAESARRDAKAAELKQLGESMHNSENTDSSAAGAANDAPQASDDSKDHGSLPPSTADSSNATEDNVDSPAPKE